MKLNLGCGNRFIPGYVHIDVVDYVHVDHVTSIDTLSMFQDGSVNLIYNCHVLEHFKRRDVARVLREWYRVLKSGGILRTSVPDLEVLCRIYLDTKEIGLVIGPLFGRQDYLYNIHYNVFDFSSLSQTLKEVGFVNIRRRCNGCCTRCCTRAPRVVSGIKVWRDTENISAGFGGPLSHIP